VTDSLCDFSVLYLFLSLCMTFIIVRHGPSQEAILNPNVPCSHLVAHLKTLAPNANYVALDLATEAGEVVDLWSKGRLDSCSNYSFAVIFLISV
jgi:hypothetical protein